MRLPRWLIASAFVSAMLARTLLAQEAPEIAPIRLEPPVRLKAGDEFIDTGKHVAHAGPLAVDLNADGMPDLLVGNFSGHFQVYMNAGTRAQPKYVDQGLLEAGGETAKVPNW
ncbi:MAG TPA: hypothetical protein VND64_33530 [Pirellulales bacterium]|nr:hypothetical protein [Pirellulales bacterium]